MESGLIKEDDIMTQRIETNIANWYKLRREEGGLFFNEYDSPIVKTQFDEWVKLGKRYIGRINPTVGSLAYITLDSSWTLLQLTEAFIGYHVAKTMGYKEVNQKGQVVTYDFMGPFNFHPNSDSDYIEYVQGLIRVIVYEGDDYDNYYKQIIKDHGSYRLDELEAEVVRGHVEYEDDLQQGSQYGWRQYPPLAENRDWLLWEAFDKSEYLPWGTDAWDRQISGTVRQHEHERFHRESFGFKD